MTESSSKRRRLEDPWLCDTCVDRKRPSDTLAPYSNAAVKRAHRQWALHYVLNHPAPRPAVLYVDDRLPKADNVDEWSYFTDDILATGRVQSHQCFSPNLKLSVVQDLRERGLVHVEHSCACQFLQRYASLIRDMYGGAVLAFIDVWGGFETGARPVIEISLALRLLNPSSSMVTFAASDRAARAQGQSSVTNYANVQCQAQSIFEQNKMRMTLVAPPEDMKVSYNTMQVHTWCVAAEKKEPKVKDAERLGAKSKLHVQFKEKDTKSSDTKWMSNVARTAACYATLKERICALEKIPGMVQITIVRQLRDDKGVDWEALRSEEEAHLGTKLPKQWKHLLVHALSTPGRFVHGGDRTRAHRANQQAIAEHEAANDAPEPVDKVADI